MSNPFYSDPEHLWRQAVGRYRRERPTTPVVIIDMGKIESLDDYLNRHREFTQERLNEPWQPPQP